MGYAFTYPLVYLFTGIKIAAYVHYPTIRYSHHAKKGTDPQALILIKFHDSSDMLQKVQDHTSILRKRGVYSKNTIWNMGKLM